MHYVAFASSLHWGATNMMDTIVKFAFGVQEFVLSTCCLWQIDQLKIFVLHFAVQGWFALAMQ